MRTGFRGTFVISWAQIEIDGLEAAPVQNLTMGAAWAWRGDVVRVDGPSDILRLDDAEGAEKLRRRAARMVHRLVGAALDGDATGARRPLPVQDETPLLDNSFIVTDGARSYTVTLIELGRGAQPLLMFQDEIPPRDVELWIVHHTLEPATLEPDTAQGGVICFTPGTRVLTPDGLRDVAELREGDLVQTKDSGAQPLRWTGRRRVSGARLFAMPHLRPIRIGAGALDDLRPDRDLLVSAAHRLLLKGKAALHLFNTDEVLVTARDLVNDGAISVDRSVREITYVHILFERHQVIWANGVETESFHPASAALETLAADDRTRLLREYPGLDVDPHIYGGFARRALSRPEAAILRHAA